MKLPVFFLVVCQVSLPIHAGLRDSDRESMYDRNLNKAEDQYIIQKQRSLARGHYCQDYPYADGCYAVSNPTAYTEENEEWP